MTACALGRVAPINGLSLVSLLPEMGSGACPFAKFPNFPFWDSVGVIRVPCNPGAFNTGEAFEVANSAISILGSLRSKFLLGDRFSFHVTVCHRKKSQ